MKSGYDSLAWLNDKDGREYVCTIGHDNEDRSFEQLSEDDKKKCWNVNEIVGTERW